MSHLAERKENNCLNCNAAVHGKYCHICGQENLPTRESVWHLVSHFFQDITHFDGKFFSTIKMLLAKPGFLSTEYMLGRRASYLNPIRLYVFTSAFFFLLFFNIVKTGEISASTDAEGLKLEVEKMDNAIEGLKKQKEEIKDSVLISAIDKVLIKFEAGRGVKEEQRLRLVKQDSLAVIKYQQMVDSLKKANAGKLNVSKKKPAGFFNFSVGKGDYKTVMAYDSVQAMLPADRQDHGLTRLKNRKLVEVVEKSKDKRADFGKKLLEKFFHSLPQMLFVSLPLYAFVLWLLYIRRKQYYYVNHAIYCIHLFCAIFIFTLIFLLLNTLLEKMGIDLEEAVNVIFFLLVFIYQYKSMRNFYQQRRAKTIIKFIILNFVMLVALILITLIFLLITIWNT